jgi:hypothetical protein
MIFAFCENGKSHFSFNPIYMVSCAVDEQVKTFFLGFCYRKCRFAHKAINIGPRNLALGINGIHTKQFNIGGKTERLKQKSL